MKFNSTKGMRDYFEQNKDQSELHFAINYLLKKLNDPHQFIGKKITNFYCNGFFGDRYDLEGSVITDVGEDYINIRDKDGHVDTAYFEEDWERKIMVDLLEEWTKLSEEWSKKREE